MKLRNRMGWKDIESVGRNRVTERRALDCWSISQSSSRKNRTPHPARALASARRHAFGLYYGRRGGGRQVRDECPRGFGLFAVGSGGGGENDFLLQFWRERTDHIQPGSSQHIHQEYTQLSLAL